MLIVDFDVSLDFIAKVDAEIFHFQIGFGDSV